MASQLADADRLDLALSERQPVRAFHISHPRRGPLVPDVHDAFELGLVMSGRTRRDWPGHRRDLAAGQAWCCGMWEPHSGTVLTAPCELLVLVAAPGFLADLRCPEAPGLVWTAPFAALPRARPRAQPAHRAELLAAGRRGIAALALPEPERSLRLRHLLLEILLILRRDWTAGPAQETAGDGWSRIGQAVRLALERPQGVSASKAAAACGLSRSHFDRLFRQLMGQGFAAFALNHRLHGAAQQLLTGDAVKSVAAAWGFTDGSHLHRHFAQRFGSGPTAWRKAAGG